MTPTLVLLGRPGCGLCEELAAELFGRFGAAAFTLEQADVDSRPDWRERYGLKIPVLMSPAGDVLCTVHLDIEAVEQYLRQGGPSPAPC